LRACGVQEKSSRRWGGGSAERSRPAYSWFNLVVSYGRTFICIVCARNHRDLTRLIRNLEFIVLRYSHIKHEQLVQQFHNFVYGCPSSWREIMCLLRLRSSAAATEHVTKVTSQPVISVATNRNLNCRLHTKQSFVSVKNSAETYFLPKY